MGDGSNRDAYWQFTGPQRFHKAVESLAGIVDGVCCDQEIHPREIDALRAWLAQHSDLRAKLVRDELYPLVESILEDGKIDEEEYADLGWVCRRYSFENAYFNEATSRLQVLHGMMAGIAADGRIKEIELRSLRDWIEENRGLRGMWPYDEIDSIVSSVLRDGVISADEHKFVLSFFGEFSTVFGERAIDIPFNESDFSVDGICAVCPEVVFESKVFCFTGKSQRAKRSEIKSVVERLGGASKSSVSKYLDYLVIGADGNPSWAFACYGRKIEEAMNWRKQGAQITLVHEVDFWDAVEDQG